MAIFAAHVAMVSLLATGVVFEHAIVPLMIPEQESKNESMKSVQECVEWSCARAESLWPLLTTKCHKKLEVDSGCVFAEVRVVHCLTNFRICAAEGSTAHDWQKGLSVCSSNSTATLGDEHQ